MRTTIIVSLLFPLILYSCDRSRSLLESGRTSRPHSREGPAETPISLIAKTDSLDYTRIFNVTYLRFEIQNRTDSIAYFTHCAERISFVLQKKINDVWIDSGGWGRICMALYRWGEKQLPANSVYSGYVHITDEGNYRLLFPFSWETNQGRGNHLDTLYSNEFTVRNSDISIWTHAQKFTDKLTGTSYTYIPKSNEISVKYSADTDLMQLNNFAHRYNLKLRVSKLDTYHYALFGLSEQDSLAEIGPEISQDPQVLHALPAYVDSEGHSVYVDPTWFIVQFKEEVNEEDIEALVLNWGSAIVMQQNVPGLYILRGAGGVRNWTVFDDVRSRMSHFEVQYTRPLRHNLFTWEHTEKRSAQRNTALPNSLCSGSP